MKKTNKAQAQEWNAQQRAQEAQQERLERASMVLYYGARKNAPDAQAFEAAGMPEVAQLIRDGVAKLDEAYTLFVLAQQDREAKGQVERPRARG